MNKNFDIKTLNPVETEILLNYKPNEKLDLLDFENESGYSKDQIAKAKVLLLSKALIKEATIENKPSLLLTDEAVELGGLLRSGSFSGNRNPYTQFLEMIKDKLVSFCYEEQEEASEATLISTEPLLMQLLAKNQEIKHARHFMMARRIDPDRALAGIPADSYHLAGLISEESENLGVLLNFLEQFISEISSAKKVRIIPAFSSLCEPTFELQLLYNNIAWLKLGKAGILRTEAVKLIKSQNPLFGWELCLDNMALVELGLLHVSELYNSYIDVSSSVPIQSTNSYF